MTRSALLRLAVLLGVLLSPRSQAGAADDLLLRIEQRHARIQDLEASFVQTYRSGSLGREMVEKGTLKLKRPGRMLWEYREPEKKLFVSDGSTWYFYVPADRQVIVREQSVDQRAPALLLAGGSMTQQFTAGLEADAAGRARLRLRPRTPDPALDRIYVDVDDQDRIVGLEVHDAQDNVSRFRFEQLRENQGLKDDLFRFRIPPGVEVISG